jgi:Skp family chaperone for outer membrane proteins
MAKLWDRLAEWLERADFVPLAVVVSVYHYYMALRAHDPFLIALPVAIFVDLTHYRTTVQAVRQRGGWWMLALLTTAAAWGLQFSFYAAGEGLNLPQQLLFSGIVPVGLGITALLKESGVRDAAARLAAELAAVQAALAAMEEKWEAAQAELQTVKEAWQQSQADAREAEAAREAAQGERQRLQAALQDEQVKRQRLQEQMGTLQADAAAFASLNVKSQAAARYLAGQVETLQAAGEMAGVGESTMSRMARKLNGDGGK